MSAINTQDKPTPINVSFSHRLAAMHREDALCLVDSKGLMTERTTSVLHLLLMHFSEGVIDAAVKEIEDINSLVTACHTADSQTQDLKNPETLN